MHIRPSEPLDRYARRFVFRAFPAFFLEFYFVFLRSQRAQLDTNQTKCAQPNTKVLKPIKTLLHI